MLDQILQLPVFRFGASEVSVLNLLKLFGWVVVVVLLERGLRKWVLSRVLARTQLQPASQFAIARIFGYAFITFGAYLGFQFAGIDLGSLALFAGAIGVGLGFGLQNVISNFVSGIIILVERPIALGDRVEVGNVEGRVTKISLRSTTVVTNDNITIIVPNSDFISSRVTNWSHGDPKVRLRLPLGVAYGTDVEKIRRLMCELALTHRAVLSEPAPHLLFTGFGESSLDFELAVWTADMAQRPHMLRSDLYYAIERCLRENGIEIPFPQRDVHLRTPACKPMAQGSAPLRESGDRQR
jgi:small-conductance mechanosensitive channel